MKKYYFVYELCLSFQNQPVHVIDAYTKYMLATLDFLIVSHLKSIIYLYHGSEKCKIGNATTNNVRAVIYEITTAMHSIIQMKLHP